MSDIIKILLEAEVSKGSIENIKSELDKIQTNIKPIKLNVDSKGTSGIKDMTLAFDKLEQVTKKNLSLDLDRLSSRYKNLIRPEDVSQIRSMISTLEHTDPKLGHNIDLIKVKMKEVSVGAEQSRRSLDLANKSAMSFGEAMKQAAYKFGIWSAITASYFKVIREISTGIKFITEMDSALTEIGMVTNQTREQTAGLAKEYNNLAKEMKVLTSDLTSSAVEFYRQGLSQEEVMERMRVSTMYSKIANLEFTTSAEVLTATVNSMGVDIERAADVFLLLGDATATSGAEIGKGFQKVGGTASALGIEFEKVSSWIAIISSKTRESAESIGTSINAMLSRISRITQTGFNEDDDTKLNDVAKALNTVGIALTDQAGNFRDFGTILDEIAVKWDTLDDQTQAYIANTVGGVRQQSRFFNLMNGYAESMDLYEQSLEAAGTAQSKFNLYLESNQATLDKFRTTLEGLWITVVDSDSLMSIVKAGTSFIEVLDGMAQSLGVVGTVSSFLIPLIGIKLVGSFKAAYIKMMKMYAANNMTLLPSPASIGATIKSMLGFTTAMEGATIATGGLTLATAGLTLGIGLLVAGVMWWANESKKAKEAFADALDNSQKLNDEVKSLNNLIKKQEELIAIENKSVEQKEELIKVQRELAQLYPELATGIDEEGNKIAENLEMTKQLTEEKRKLLEQELLVIKTTADTRLPQLRQELADMQDEAQRIQDRLTSGDTTETRYNRSGMSRQVDVTQELKDRLLELVNAQKENYEETIKLEDGVRSYNQILEENAERHKWARAEEIESQAVKEKSKEQLSAMQRELEELGFTSDEVTLIISGNLKEVRDNHKLLDDAFIESMMTVQDLEESKRVASINMLKNSRELTVGMINDIKARIRAMREEASASLALAGMSIMSRPPESIPMPKAGEGILTTVGKMESHKLGQANKELSQLEGRLSNIDSALSNLNSIGSSGGQISGTKTPKKSSGSKSSKTKKEEYKAEADRYARINSLLDKNNVLLQRNKILQDLAGNDLNEKLKVMEEQIKLEKEHQGLLHQKANVARTERLELERALSRQGFSFLGDGDDREITNLNNIKGKTKEVEEQFNRYNNIQSKEIPGLQQSWMNLSKSIKNVSSAIKDLNRQIFEGQRDGIYSIYSDGIKNLEHQISLERELIELTSNEDEKSEMQLKINSLTESQIYMLKELNSQREYELNLMREIGDTESDRYKSLLDNYRSTELKILQLQRQQKQEYESMVSDVISAIKDGYRQMLELEKASVNQKVKLAEEEYNKKIKLLDDWLSHHNGIVDEMLKDMDRLNETEDYDEQLNELKKQKVEAEDSLERALNLSDSAVDKDARVADARKELEKINSDIDKTMRDRARTLRKQELQDTKDQNSKIVEDKKNSEQAKIDSVKSSAEREIQIIEQKYDALINNDRMYESIREDIMKGTYTNANEHISRILNSLQRETATSVGAMGKSWQELENTIYRVVRAQEALQNLGQYSSVTDGVSGESSNTDLDKQIIGSLQRQYMSFIDDNVRDTILKEQEEGGHLWKLNQEAEKIRKRHGWNYVDYTHLPAPGFRDGGVVDFTGVANVHGSKTSAEVVFNAGQAKKLHQLIDNLPKTPHLMLNSIIPKLTLPSLKNTGDEALKQNSDNIYNIELNIDKVTGGTEGGKQVFSQLIKEIKLRGGII